MNSKLKYIFICLLLETSVSNKFVSATVYNFTGDDQTRYVTTANKLVETSAKGFVFFTNGITFNGTVNAALPVPINGNIVFGNGTTSKLVLETDLTIGSTAGTGTIPMQINTSTGYAEIDGTGGTITFDGDTFFPSNRAFRILSNLTIDGGGHDMVFGTNLTFTIEAGATLTIRDAHLRNLANQNFVGEGTLILYNDIVTLDNDWTFSGYASRGTPRLIFDDFTVFKGTNKTFTYAGSRNMILVTDAQVTFDSTVTFSWGNNRRFGFEMDNTENLIPTGNVSHLHFNNSNFYIPSKGSNNGLRITKGALMFENKCNIYNESNTNATKSLELGDGITSNNNTSIYVLAGATINVDGYLFYNCI